MSWLKGIHYRNRLLYDLQNRLKLGRDYDLRFRLAARSIGSGESVLDVCSAFGQLKDFLPAGCAYRCIEASRDFARILEHKNIPVTVADLHNGLPDERKTVDVGVMIVSLAQFRNTSADELLEGLKKMCRKVVIVEDVLHAPRGKRSLIQFLMNYLCHTEYYRPIELLTADEFQALMRRHGFSWERYDDRYAVGLFKAT